MTSDHVEKLFDVHDLVNGKHSVYFERNTGREPIQFYFAAFLVEVFNTGFTHLTLKISPAAAGFLMLPFVFLLGREIEDTNFGLLAMAMAAISFWATAISRVGLRFPLTPLFVAPTLLFLLRGAAPPQPQRFFVGRLVPGHRALRLQHHPHGAGGPGGGAGLVFRCGRSRAHCSPPAHQPTAS